MERTRRWERYWPWAVAVGSALAVAAGVPLAAANWGVVGPYDIYTMNAVVGVAVPFVGAFLLSRRPGHRIGLLLLSTAGLSVSFLTQSWCTYATVTRPGALPGAAWAGWVGGWTWVPFLALVTLLPLWFPTGRPPSRAWLPVQWVVLGLLVAITGIGMVEPRVGIGLVENPLVSTPEWTTRVQETLLIPGTVFLGALLCLPSTIVRYRRAGPEERRQQRWFALATGLAVACLLGPTPPPPAEDVITGLALVLVAVAIAVAVVRSRLYDIDVLINRTLVYGVLTLLSIGLYLGAVATAGLVLPSGALVLGTAAVAVAFAPLRHRLQRLIDRLLYGDRLEPYTALTRLATKLEANLAPEEVLTVALGDVLTALRVPHAEITVHGEQLAQAGRAPDDGRAAEDTPLTHGGLDLGELRVATRRPGEQLTGRDRLLLADLARPLGAAVHAVALAAELQRSRERLVTTREQERHRLHRDLHDGLGPSLAALVFGLDGVRHAVRRGADAEQLIDALKADVQAAIADVRRVVYELRPPALDELGLVGALERQLQPYRHGPATPWLHLDAPVPLPTLPAAVEVAAYRIVTEAVANAVRHARAGRCQVRLVLNGHLEVEVTDDGAGLPSPVPSGAGLRSLQERAAELGGVCSVTSRPGGGTVVRAELPVSHD